MLTLPKCLRLFLVYLILASAPEGSAQSIVPSNDGLNTNINQIGRQYNITGGIQTGSNLFHSLQKLGLTTGEIANFLSDPSIQNILTRVTGGEASLINGLLQVTGSNANLFIMNPAGIVFGANASLNIPANFSATTAIGIQVGNGWFGVNSSVDEVRQLNGNITGYGFTAALPSLDPNNLGNTGVILNQGNLSTSIGQSVTLVGGKVVNTGTIATPSGNITIATTSDNKFIKITNEGNVLSYELPISDRQAIGNAPVLRGVDLPSLLTGKNAGSTVISGNLDVSGDKGGNVQIFGNDVSLTGANIIASGINDGGKVLIGGDLQGVGTTPKSLFTSVDANSKISADSLVSGNGGQVVVWSDGATAFNGNISAMAGNLNGNGGFTEVSGKQRLTFDGLVDLRALNGATGNLLLDPTTLVIANTGGDITPSTVANQWNLANTTYSATTSLTVSDPVVGNSANSLTLDSPITNLNAGITNVGTGSLLGTANTVNVGANGLVQNGVDVAANGANVNLATATYTLGSTVNINKDLTVNGAGAANTKVSGNNTVQVFNIGNNSTVNINDLTVANGKSDGNGGGAFINARSILNLTNSIFSSNSASVSLNSGGAIYNLGTTTISNSKFSNNNLASFGGAIYNSGSATIINNIFSGNLSQIAGGAIYNSGILAVEKNTFLDNGAALGGAIYNFDGRATINNNSLFRNSAQSGGAIYNSATATVSNNIFSNNFADKGGAIYNIYGAIITSNNTFSDNGSSGNPFLLGGAIYNIGGGTATILNSTFSSNSAQSGGAIYNTGIATILNSSFSSNSAQGGGAILNGGTAVINNSTFFGNFAQFDGGAIYNYDFNIGVAKVSNSILVGNNALNGAEVFNSSTVNFTGANIVGTNGVDGISGTYKGVTPITPTGSANTVINTTLSDNGGSTKTLALVADSIAIDAGDNSLAPPTDQRGAARPPYGTGNGTKVDIGAYEISPSYIVTRTPDDSGTGSLRTAINFTNTHSSAAKQGTILFQIPTIDSGYTGAYWSIATTSALPDITKPVIIDGYSQTGAIANSLLSGNTAQIKIELNGNNAGSVNGLTLGHGSDGSTIKGLAINSLSQAGIVLTGGNNAIAGNFIGTDITGTIAKSNGLEGIRINSANNIIGGTNPADRNIIAFNAKGVTVNNNTSTGNQILSNSIFGNTSIGIDLNNDGITVNGITPRNFPNSGQNYPLLFTANDSNVSGVINSAPNTTYRLEFFASESSDQGKNFLGATNVNTDANGIAKFSSPITAIPSGQFVTATATNSTTGTSEFSATSGLILNAISGTPQNTTVNQPFTDSLQVKVSDTRGNPAANGIPISFSVPISGARGIFTEGNTAITNNAIASVPIKANIISGNYTAVAAIDGVSSTNFNLTNNPDVPATVTATGGTPQSTIIATAFTNQLQVVVKDQFGNLVPNSTVTFTVPNSGASGVFTGAVKTIATTSNTNGIAQVPIAANKFFGDFISTAQVVGFTNIANFNLTNLIPTTPPELEAHRQQERNPLNPKLLRDFPIVTFFLPEDIEPEKIHSFLSKVVELMNQNGGTFSIEAIAILRDAKIGIADFSTNENAIQVAIQRAIAKSIGSEYLSLINIQSDTENNSERKRQIFKINVRKSSQPAKLKL
jgi:filamentous hemagglutinin family protein